MQQLLSTAPVRSAKTAQRLRFLVYFILYKKKNAADFFFCCIRSIAAFFTMTDMETQTPRQSAFMARMSSYPMMGSLTTAYGLTKAFVPLVSRAEHILLSTAEPLVGQSLDQFACDKLDRLESAASGSVARSQRLVQGALHTTVQTTAALRAVQQRVVGSAANAARATLLTAESTAASVSDRFVNVAEWGVDLMLPPNEHESQPEAAPAADKSVASYSDVVQLGAAATTGPKLGYEASKVLQHVRNVSSKAQARILAQTLRSLHTVQERSQETIDRMKPFTVDLIAYARDFALGRPAAVEEAGEEATEGAARSSPIASYTALAVAVAAARATELRQLLAARLADTKTLARQRYGYLAVHTIRLEKQMMGLATATIHHYPSLEHTLQAAAKLPGVGTAYMSAATVVLLATQWLPSFDEGEKVAIGSDNEGRSENTVG